MDCPLEKACHRNSNRKEKVEDDVIISMATRFEKPDAVSNKWEKYSMTVQVNQDCDLYMYVDLFIICNSRIDK